MFRWDQFSGIISVRWFYHLAHPGARQPVDTGSPTGWTPSFQGDFGWWIGCDGLSPIVAARTSFRTPRSSSPTRWFPLRGSLSLSGLNLPEISRPNALSVHTERVPILLTLHQTLQKLFFVWKQFTVKYANRWGSLCRTASPSLQVLSILKKLKIHLKSAFRVVLRRYRIQKIS